MGDRVKQYIGNTYKIFEENLFYLLQITNPLMKLWKELQKFFKDILDLHKEVKKQSKKSHQEARFMVQNVLESVPKTKPKGELPFFKYTNLTLGAETPDVMKSFARTVLKGKFARDPEGKIPTVIGKGSKVFRELFGEIKDPRYSFLMP